MAKVHISCALSVSLAYLDEVSHLINDIGHHWTRWERNAPGIYSDYWIKDADAVVFILPDNAWSRSGEPFFPIGQKKELDMAVSSKKPLFLAYKTVSAGIKIYKASLWFGGITGVSGTTSKFADLGGLPHINNPCGESGEYLKVSEGSLMWSGEGTWKQSIFKENTEPDIRLLLRK